MADQEKAMKRAASITIGTGLIFAASALPVLHPAVHLFLQIAHWPFHEVPSDLGVPTTLLVAISGGLVTGLGGMLWALARFVSPVSSEAAARVAQITAWSWFCTDSSMSILVGAPANVVINSSFLALILFCSKPNTATEGQIV